MPVPVGHNMKHSIGMESLQNTDTARAFQKEDSEGKHSPLVVNAS